MILNIGERIRELRRERALTQDDVARRLNISAQAVSKWENAVSYPDLELIPPLAELLGVSIDGLFRADSEIEADDCCRRADEMLLDPNRSRESLPMLREAAIRYPFHAGLLRRLGTALHFAYLFPADLGKTVKNESGEETLITHGDPGLLRESIAAFERALDNAKEQNERDLTVKSLIAVYVSAGERDKARLSAERQSSLVFSREIMLAESESGENKDKASADALLALFTQTAVMLLKSIPGSSGSQRGADDEARVIHAQRCVATAKYIESFFPDGRCGRLHFILAQLLYYPTALFAALDEFEKADECFVSMARHEKANRAYGEGGEYRYSGPLFDKVTDREPRYVKYEPTKQPFTEEYKTHIKETPELSALLT